MFICPQCNSVVADPEFRLAPWWWRGRGNSRRMVPVCPAGHCLRSQVLGNLSEMPLAGALARALAFSAIGLWLGLAEDSRLGLTGGPHVAVKIMTAVAFAIGIIALGDAWLWAGRSGPVHRLTGRALGTAAGYLVPAIAGCHALYFHWAEPVQMAYGRAVAQLFRAVVSGS